MRKSTPTTRRLETANSDEIPTDSRSPGRTDLRRCDGHGPWRAVYRLLAVPLPDGDLEGPGGDAR